MGRWMFLGGWQHLGGHGGGADGQEGVAGGVAPGCGPRRLHRLQRSGPLRRLLHRHAVLRTKIERCTSNGGALSCFLVTETMDRAVIPHKGSAPRQQRCNSKPRPRTCARCWGVVMHLELEQVQVGRQVRQAEAPPPQPQASARLAGTPRHQECMQPELQSSTRPC